jgi:hypothetical protein
MDKDRESVHPIAGTDDIQIVYRRSSARPVEYAILLQVRGAKGWETRIVADNSHADRHVDEHHCHRYLEGEKQAAEPLPFGSPTRTMRWQRSSTGLPRIGQS